ncbi:hypothetical protein AALA44_04430 [Enterococcus ratti]|uniref:hypothetical protein n=1 Tax=Enterococcus ratti TaxID=150033 RepID=UPI003514EB5C
MGQSSSKKKNNELLSKKLNSLDKKLRNSTRKLQEAKKKAYRSQENLEKIQLDSKELKKSNSFSYYHDF